MYVTGPWVIGPMTLKAKHVENWQNFGGGGGGIISKFRYKQNGAKVTMGTYQVCSVGILFENHVVLGWPNDVTFETCRQLTEFLGAVWLRSSVATPKRPGPP